MTIKRLLAPILLLLPISLLAGEDKYAELQSALSSNAYPAFFYFLENSGGRYTEAVAAFAKTSPENRRERLAEWRDFEMLLRGGKLDSKGALIRNELAKLPGEQWHFIVRLERERRALYNKLGWGPGGNIRQNGAELIGVRIEPRLCSDRSEKLTALMAPVENMPAFRNWKTEEITANMISVRDSRGLRDELYGGVHWANCFVYNDGSRKVEIVADAWANALVPAYTWWYHFDKGTHEFLYRSGGRDWCGSEILEKAVQAQIRARRTAASPVQKKSSTLNGLKTGKSF